MANNQIIMRCYTERHLKLLTGTNHSNALGELVRHGLRWEMTHNSSTPIAAAYLREQSNVWSVYEKYLDAKATVAEVKGPLGNTCRLVEVPKHSRWVDEDSNLREYLPLDADEVLGKDGEIYWRTKSE